MIKIFAVSAKLTSLKYTYFKIKVMASSFILMTSPTKFYHVNQIIMVIWQKFDSFGYSTREVTAASIL